ncbi:hypothetical protein [Streptosporangium vulgare]|uniref:Uncharacterized protein n=1 Tax=Streptosporangium vulgare TaxID=46190 RepID=A0ABV5TRC1_9ACTN
MKTSPSTPVTSAMPSSLPGLGDLTREVHLPVPSAMEQPSLPQLVIVYQVQPNTAAPREAPATISLPVSWGKYVFTAFIAFLILTALMLGLDPAPLLAIVRL